MAETNGSGSHHIDIADVDCDGRDEVFDGTTCLNPDGTVRWSIYREHPDIVAIKHILPGGQSGASGRQVFYAVESNVHAGAYLVDANTGKVLWKLNREDDPRVGTCPYRLGREHLGGIAGHGDVDQPRRTHSGGPGALRRGWEDSAESVPEWMETRELERR